MKETILEKIVKTYNALIYWFILYAPFVQLYQPVFKSKGNKKLTRACVDRWNAFSPYLPEKLTPVLDIGCNIGYFSFKCAEQGRFVCGVESHISNITICNAIKSKTARNNAIFIKQFVDEAFIAQIPDFDVVIHLSVFHHWVKQHGLDKSTVMMKDLTQNTSCLVFETGQSTEKGSQWESVLAFMGESPEQWIRNFLKDLGFKSINNIGTFATGLTQTERFVFVARR